MRISKKYLEELPGVKSLIRLQSLILFSFSLVLIVVQVIIEKVYVELDAMLLLMSFLPKTVQKFAESSQEVKSVKNEKELPV